MKSDAMVTNTAEEFESLGMEMLRKFLRIPVWPVGPLLRLSGSHSIDTSLEQWLDSNPADSVVYISFGSQNTITASQMMELATGLEASGAPFIWAIRPPLGYDAKGGGFRPEWLPECFQERIMRGTKRGVLLHGWAPQVEILSHVSVGAFLSHCGWNSVLESLVCGVPIIGWPLTGDQIYNSKLLEEEMGVCVEVERGIGESCTGVRERVRKGIELVMTEKKMREKAREIGKVMREAMREEKIEGEGSVGSSVEGLNELLKMTASI